jgi:phosphoketolase
MGGPNASTAVTESVLAVPDLGELPLQEFPVGGDKQVATTAMGALVGHVGQQDPQFMCDQCRRQRRLGHQQHQPGPQNHPPHPDDLYFQQPQGQVYEPLSEDACAGSPRPKPCLVPAPSGVPTNPLPSMGYPSGKR